MEPGPLSENQECYIKNRVTAQCAVWPAKLVLGTVNVSATSKLSFGTWPGCGLFCFGFNEQIWMNNAFTLLRQ